VGQRHLAVTVYRACVALGPVLYAYVTVGAEDTLKYKPIALASLRISPARTLSRAKRSSPEDDSGLDEDHGALSFTSSAAAVIPACAPCLRAFIHVIGYVATTTASLPAAGRSIGIA
jgi:hypothetical protein